METRGRAGEFSLELTGRQNSIKKKKQQQQTEFDSD